MLIAVKAPITVVSAIPMTITVKNVTTIKTVILNSIAMTIAVVTPVVKIMAPLWSNAAKYVSDWVNTPKS